MENRMVAGALTALPVALFGGVAFDSFLTYDYRSFACWSMVCALLIADAVSASWPVCNLCKGGGK